jgi:hypothetical protein
VAIASMLNRSNSVEWFVDAEQMLEHVIEPEPCRRAPEEIVAFGKMPPDRPAVGLDRRAVERRNAKLFQPDALAEQHAENVVIGHDQQLRRVRKRLVQRKPARVRMTMRADDRQVLDRGIERAGQRKRASFGGKQQIRIGQCGHVGPPPAIHR